MKPSRPNRIVRYTESGIPVSERRDAVVKTAKALAAMYREEMDRKIAAGEVPEPPVRKTQADVWEERQA